MDMDAAIRESALALGFDHLKERQVEATPLRSMAAHHCDYSKGVSKEEGM